MNGKSAPCFILCLTRRCARSVLQLALLFVLQSVQVQDAEAARDISPQRECANCHIMWLVDFNRKDVTTLIPYDPRPVMPTGRQDVVSNDRMCFSCHDGFVLDSRFAWTNRQNFHPIGVKPSNKVNIPTIEGKTVFPLNDNGKVYCGTCHSAHSVQWGDKSATVFLRVKNANSGMCMACHLNRSTGTAEGNHPVLEELKKIEELKGIPHKLTEGGAKFGTDGSVICQSCHRVHGAPEKKLLVEKNANSELCSNCHIKQRRVAKTKHNMKLVDETDKNVRGQEVGKAGACSACHLPHNGQGPKMWARTLKQGEDPVSDLCLSCHREGGLAKDKLVGEFTHPVGRDMARLEETVALPGYTRKGIKSVGDGKGRVSCPSCHDPHQWDPRDPEKTSKPGDKGSGENKFLRKANGPEAGLCLTCHKNRISVENTKHDLTVMAPTARNIKGQTPAKSGVCASCHLPHNGKGARMWAREPKAGAEPAAAICLSCHNPKGIAKEKAIGANNHPFGVPIANIGVTAKDGKWTVPPESIAQPDKVLPLYDDRGMPVTEGGKVFCGTCHDPHNWSPLKKGSPSGNPLNTTGTGKNSFLRLPNDKKSTLCANCHVNKVPVGQSKHNLVISAPDAKNSKGRTTAESGLCGACHIPHNGGEAKLWARATGPGQDSIEALCRECHRDEGIAAKKQTGANSHPLQVDLKNIGGKTTLPLYTAAGKKDNVNGKVSCATCHDPHLWDAANPSSKAGAKTKVEGGPADSFLRLPASPSPQLCANCHQNKQWVKKTDHDLTVTAPKATNVRGQTARQSGVCGQCHLVHNAESQKYLWARPLGVGNDVLERLCRSCHATDKVAAAKLPVKATHPPTVKVLSNPDMQRKDGGYFPAFTPDGLRGSSGIITCPTCHNAHQWDPRKAEEGRGRNTEGDSRTSFLRNNSDFSLCTNCHGLDALFRYKYFHGAMSRKKHATFR